MSCGRSKTLVCWFGINPGLEFCQAFMIQRTNCIFKFVFVLFLRTAAWHWAKAESSSFYFWHLCEKYGNFSISLLIRVQKIVCSGPAKPLRCWPLKICFSFVCLFYIWTHVSSVILIPNLKCYCFLPKCRFSINNYFRFQTSISSSPYLQEKCWTGWTGLPYIADF